MRDPDAATALSDLGVELVPGDLADAAALDRLCEGADGLFHGADWYKVGSPDPEVGHHVNVDGTRNALEAARRNGVPRVVYTSSAAVNSDTGGRVVDETYRFPGSHLSVYDETKALAHDIAVEYASDGLDVVILQPGWAHVEDVARGHVLGWRRAQQERRTCWPGHGRASPRCCARSPRSRAPRAPSPFPWRW